MFVYILTNDDDDDEVDDYYFTITISRFLPI